MDRSHKTIVVPAKERELLEGKNFRVALIAHDTKKQIY